MKILVLIAILAAAAPANAQTYAAQGREYRLEGDRLFVRKAGEGKFEPSWLKGRVKRILSFQGVLLKQTENLGVVPHLFQENGLYDYAFLPMKAVDMMVAKASDASGRDREYLLLLDEGKRLHVVRKLEVIRRTVRYAVSLEGFVPRRHEARPGELVVTRAPVTELKLTEQTMSGVAAFEVVSDAVRLRMTDGSRKSTPFTFVR